MKRGDSFRTEEPATVEVRTGTIPDAHRLPTTPSGPVGLTPCHPRGAPGVDRRFVYKGSVLSDVRLRTSPKSDLIPSHLPSGVRRPVEPVVPPESVAQYPNVSCPTGRGPSPASLPVRLSRQGISETSSVTLASGVRTWDGRHSRSGGESRWELNTRSGRTRTGVLHD